MEFAFCNFNQFSFLPRYTNVSFSFIVLLHYLNLPCVFLHLALLYFLFHFYFMFRLLLSSVLSPFNCELFIHHFLVT